MKARPCWQKGGKRGLKRVSHVWNYPEERGLTRCSAARWWRERKETTLFPFRVKSESQCAKDWTHLWGKNSRIFPFFRLSCWLCRFHKVSGTEQRKEGKGHCSTPPCRVWVCQQLISLKFKEQSDRKAVLAVVSSRVFASRLLPSDCTQ